MLRVLTWNIYEGGHGFGRHLLRELAHVIRRTGAHLCLLQEVTDETHADQAQALARELGWPHVLAQGIVFAHDSNDHPAAIISQFPLEPTAGRFGARVHVPRPTGSSPAFAAPAVFVFNTHLPSSPYQPYQLRGIPYHDAPFFSTPGEAVAAASETRGEHVAAVVADIRQTLAAFGAAGGDLLVVVGMDANEPSALDWTPATVLTGQQPACVPWPSLQQLCAGAALMDAVRAHAPSPVLAPETTWQPYAGLADKADHRDRIDVLLYRTAGRVALRSAGAVGEAALEAWQAQAQDSAGAPPERWPSDHRAVLAEFVLSNA